LLIFADLAILASLAGGHAGVLQMLLHGRQDGVSDRLVPVWVWRTRLILLIEQFTFMLKKIGFGDDRFLPSLPPNSPPGQPHDAPPCQAAHLARRLIDRSS
jgi:hypothetical protein